MKKKKIGLIGAGFVGSSLAKQLVKLGYFVKVANSRGVETLREFEKETGAIAVELEEVVTDIDILFIAIPLGNIPSLKNVIDQLPKSAIIVDTGNYYPDRDGSIPELEKGIPETVWVSQQLQFPIVKAFNNTIAYENGLIVNSKKKGTKGRIALPVSADNENARILVMEIVEQLGFTAYDAGTLSESWRQQPGQPAYATNPSIEELPLLLKKAIPQDKARENQAKGAKIMEKLPPNFPTENLVRVSRLMVGLDKFNPKSWWAMLKLGVAMLKK